MNKKQKKMARRIAIGGGLFLLGLILKQLVPYVGEVFMVAAWLSAGHEVLADAFEKIKAKKPFDEDFLMTVASVCAIFLGEFVEAAAVMLFFQVGELFESIAVERSRKSVAALMDLRPDVAYILVDGEWEESDPEDVQVGDLIRVNPGERIPVDGIIVEGSASVDTSKITGESVPADVAAGDKVLSGCINLSGVLTVRAESEFASSTVARILDLMDSASEGRSRTESLITRFAQVYTPCVVYAALALAFLPPLFTGFDFATWVHRALNFLVVSCPCALVISVPLAYFSGMGAVSKAGMIAKGGIALENLAKVDTFVFDKTGTLTIGDFRVVRVESDRNDLLELVAAAEKVSHHPIARAIVKATGNVPEASEIREIPGQGIKATVDGKTVLCGNHRLLREAGIRFDPVSDETGTCVLVAVDDRFMGYLLISDTIKDGAKDAIGRLRKNGMATVMLTGDAEDSARNVARKVGIEEVHAKLLPHQKLERLRAVRKEKGAAMFVGDGINDAPVLAGADVGAAMGNGADAAIEAADVVFMTGDPRAIPEALDIASRTARIAWQNVYFALAVKAAAMVLGLLGFASMWVAVFADSGVAMLCVLNSIRMLYRKK